MQPWLKWLLIVVVSVAVLYGALVAFAEYSDGNNVHVTLHLGRNPDGHMYLKCDQQATTDGICTGGDQAVVTVQKRDRVKVTLVNDERGDHTHDFNIEGWQYAFPPISPEMELHQSTESWTFTAWASGSYHMLCEISGHDQAGMHGTFIVK